MARPHPVPLLRRLDRPTLLRLRQALQTAFAALAGWLVAELFGLAQGYWGVITAILVVQAFTGSVSSPCSNPSVARTAAFRPRNSSALSTPLWLGRDT